MSKPPAKHDARAVLREYIKRFGDVPEEEAKQIDEKRSFRWREDLFDYQLNFIDDPAKLKTALCSRRAGKTYCACYYLIEVATRKPGSISAYIALTRGSAKRLMWAELKRAARKYMLDVKFNNSELIATLKNGSQIILTGANDEADVDKLRGSAYALVILDEAASFGPHMDSLVEEVLEPALVDHKGTMAMIGTPSAACSGMFHNATTDKSYGYSNHAWTIRDNPHIPHSEEWLAKRKKQRGWADHNPIYLREWCGQWVRSDDSLVYRFTEKNIVQSIPLHEHEFEFVLGVDLGYEDSTGFVIGAFTRDLPDFYVVETHKEKHLIPSQIAERIREYHGVYNFTVMVADTGGLGKSIVEEFKTRYYLPMRPAEKRHKLSYQELLNGDLADGKVKVLEGSDLLEEWKYLQYDEAKRRDSDRYENHLSDACLYAWRESRHYTHSEPTLEPEPGTAAYNRKIEQRIIERLENKLNGEEQPWWETAYQLN